MLHHEYETIIIVRPDVDEAAIEALVEKMQSVITDNEGRLLIRDDWGHRKLAYQIGRHLKGYYVLYNYTAPASLVAELERKIRIEDSIMRFLTVKIADMVDVELRERQAAEQRRLRAEEEAKAKAEAEARAAEAAAAAEAQAEAAAAQQEEAPDSEEEAAEVEA